MKILFDTNVVLDLLLDRAPFAEASEQILSRVEAGDKLLALFEIAPVNRPILENALESDFSDFEDSVLHEAAMQVGADAIVTRNQSDFRQARLPVHSPEEMIRILDQQSQDG